MITYTVNIHSRFNDAVGQTNTVPPQTRFVPYAHEQCQEEGIFTREHILNCSQTVINAMPPCSSECTVYGNKIIDVYTGKCRKA